MNTLMERLLTLTSDLAYEKDTQAVLAKLSQTVRTLLGVDICSIFLHDPDAHQLWALVKQKADTEIRVADTQGIVGHVFQQQEPLLIADPYADSRFNPDIDRQTGYTTRAILALPLRDRKGLPVGVVQAVNKLDGTAFSEADLQMLQHLALYISAFVENTILWQRLKHTQEEVVHRLSRASRFKDEETFNHTVRVGHFALHIAEATEMAQDDRETLFLAAPMHDIGKMGIPDAIIGKPGKLTDEEFAQIKHHTNIGADILTGSDSDLIHMASAVALSHHERWDGRGYPEGKAAEEIPIAARITSIADVFDALCSERPYKPAWPIEKAIAELSDKRGSQFDADLVDAFLRDIDAVQLIRSRFPDTDAQP